ncbi:MAG: hypothetical protein ACRDJH_15215 [Thermomicrobiales bacterium]
MDDDTTPAVISEFGSPIRTQEITDVSPDPPTREARLAYLSMGLFGIVLVAGSVSAVWGQGEWDRTKDFLQIVVPVITLLIGATAGHYFGKHL